MRASVLTLCRKLSSSLLSVLCVVGLLMAQSAAVQAQSASDFTIEVQVASQSGQERNNAYSQAFDRVLRRQVETRVRVEPEQRTSLMQDASLYVQSFRYRSLDPVVDGLLLATNSVRDGAEPASVIAVTFPTDLAAIIQQQLIPVVEEPEVVEESPVIALVAVEQQGNQFIIGGDRGRRFQQRATELAAANNLQLLFPEFTPEDLELINASDIFNSDTDRINSFMTRFAGSELLAGAIYRISPTVWQSDWSYTSAVPDSQFGSTELAAQEQQTRTFGLSTATLDEALIAAMTQVGSSGGSLAESYEDPFSDEQAGTAIRIEGIRTLEDYDSVLAMLRQTDVEVQTELLELNAVVFRASDLSVQRMRNLLLSNNRFQPINDEQSSQVFVFQYFGQ